jgi:putative AlgH/UPF0301 family transcriptional regulator
MTMHPDNVTKLLSSDSHRYRLFAGFSGWAPRQLNSEFEREGWYVLPADEEIVFRKDTGGLWEELIERLRALKTEMRGVPDARNCDIQFFEPAPCMESS